MTVVGFDGIGNVSQRHLAGGVERQRLRLDAAQHRRTAALITVGVRRLADEVFVAPLAMRHQAAQIALRAGGHEQGCLKTQHVGDALLQGIDGGVIAIHIITQRRGKHGRTHGGCWPGHGVAAQVNCCVHGAPLLQKVLEHRMTVLSEDGLGVKLQALYGQAAVPHTHDLAIIGPGGELKLGRT